MPASRINIFNIVITLNELLNNDGSIRYGSTVGCSAAAASKAEIKRLHT